MKVLLIGLDGATWNLIRPWAKKGKLPEFKRLMENGVWGDLESTVPPYTIPAWLSLSTGKTPQSLGLYTFMLKRGYDFKPYFMVKRRKRTFWDILSENGKKVCILNPPDVYSAYRINGVMLAGFLCTSKEKLIYPPSLKKELKKVVDNYEIDSILIDAKGTPNPRKSEEKKLDHIFKVHEKHFKTFKHIIIHEQPDFSFLVFTLPDRIQHNFWSDKKVLLNCYKMIDSQLKDLMEFTDENTIVFLVSDHGFGPLKRNFYINEWLIKEKYLVLKNEKKNKHLLIKIQDILAYKKRVRSIILFLFSILHPKIKEIYQRKTRIIRIYNANIEWEKTKAFAYSGLGEIYLNVKGREPYGIIEKKDYEKIRNTIIEKLRRFRDPNTGKRISINVLKLIKSNKRNFYSDSPDLIIKEGSEISVSPGIGHDRTILNFEEYIAGQHTMEGIFLAKGPNIKKDAQITGVKIHDVAPTILQVFSVPIPKEMDGKVVKAIFETDSELAKKEVVYQRFKTEKERIKRKIEKLRKKNIGLKETT